MNRYLHQPTQCEAFRAAAIACASLLVAGAGLASVPSPHGRPAAVVRPLVSQSTTMTPQQAARFRATMNKIPRLNRLSGRAQVQAFVAYFKARGFQPTVYTAKYLPSGRIETLEYHASRGSRFSNKVDVSFSKRGTSTAISMDSLDKPAR